MSKIKTKKTKTQKVAEVLGLERFLKTYKIEKETEKAVNVVCEFESEGYENSGEYDSRVLKLNVWLPKSTIENGKEQGMMFYKTQELAEKFHNFNMGRFIFLGFVKN